MTDPRPVAPAAQTLNALWRAISTRDPAWDGRLIFAVKTTGIYCRPSCPARRPKPENVLFLDHPAQARALGYRACKRCQPDAAPGTSPATQKLIDACRDIEATDPPPSLADLAASAEMSPHHFQKTFRAQIGLTPKQYALALRNERLLDALVESTSVTQAIFDAGFPSLASAYATLLGDLGAPPRALTRGGAHIALWTSVHAVTLGQLLVAGTDRGVCAILLGDSTQDAEQDLARRFPRAQRIACPSHVTSWIDGAIASIERPAKVAIFPLDIQGTAFQRQVWNALRKIPPRTTTTYSDIAETLDRPTAQRAVANAVGANPLAVVIPCHRVVRRDGSLGGYRWGIKRKRALLQREESDND